MSIVEQILAGDVRATARVLRDIDDQIPSVHTVLKELYPHTGKAYVIGFTGSPGVGKSTLVDQLVMRYRKDGLTVGILAVDPTSPFSGGAIRAIAFVCSGTFWTAAFSSAVLPPAAISAVLPNPPTT